MIERLLRLAIGAAGMVALAVYTLGLAARYVFKNLTPDWAEEVTVFALLWGVLIAGLLLVMRDRHLTAGFISGFPDRWQIVFQRIGAAVAMAFCAYLAVQGVALVQLDMRLGEVSKSTLQLPIAPIHAIFPVIMALMALAYLPRVLGRRRAIGDTHQPGDAE